MDKNDFVCKSKTSAFLALNTVIGHMPAGTQRAALTAVSEWLRSNIHDDITRMTPKERESQIIKLLASWRDNMTKEQREEMSAFFLSEQRHRRNDGKSYM
jgi:uncharacterized protein YchJ